MGPWGHAAQEAETAVLWILRGGGSGGNSVHVAPGSAQSLLLGFYFSIVNPGPKRVPAPPGLGDLCVLALPRVLSSLPSLEVG